jgi:hypothetical protein
VVWQIWLRSLEWQCLLEQWVQQQMLHRQQSTSLDHTMGQEEEEEEEPLNKIPRLRSAYIGRGGRRVVRDEKE